jgi:hypothetical protein
MTISLPPNVRFVAALVSLCIAANAQAQPGTSNSPVILVDGNTPGYYNNAIGTALDGTAPQFPAPLGSGGGDPLINPSAEPILAAATNQLGNWLTPNSALNANWQKLTTIPATWAGNTETAIIYEVSGGATGYTNVFADFDADNGVFVWVNGVYKFGARGPGLPSPIGQYEYTNIFLGNLSPGTNRIQVLREDNFDATGYQVRITGLPIVNADSCATVFPGPISWWRAEGNAQDSADGNSGTLLNGAEFATGRVGQAFSFDGVDDHVRVANSSNLQITNAITIETWVRPTSTGQFQNIVSKWDALDVGQRAFAIGLDPSGVVFWGFSPNGGDWPQSNAYSTNALPLDVWTHIAGTYDGSTTKLYVNGVLHSETPYTLGIFLGNIDLAIGGTVGGAAQGQSSPRFRV